MFSRRPQSSPPSGSTHSAPAASLLSLNDPLQRGSVAGDQSIAVERNTVDANEPVAVQSFGSILIYTPRFDPNLTHARYLMGLKIVSST